MAKYILHIQIERNILKTLTDNGYSLCIQNYIQESKAEVANVIPAARGPRDYSSRVDFTWTGSYVIAATDRPYEEGGIISQTSTDLLKISTKGKQALVLNSWGDYSVKSNVKSVPENAFGFHPGNNIQNPGASVVIYLANGVSGDNEPAPFYISPNPSIGGAEDIFIPLEKVVVFFYKGAESGSMVSSSRFNAQVIDLTQEREQTWKLQDDKSWVEVPKYI
ncbi:hypothetical protein H0H92_014312 [Tricholoma furcatifolium]|nr:hypothetical protein H0H92_014312 [Tricholoma furcatifolium]